MILAIVGSRKFSAAKGMKYAERLIRGEIENEFLLGVVTGDPVYSNASGIDALTVRICKEYGLDCRIFAPVHRRWEPDGFKERNKRIATACDELLCIRDPGSSTYGAGWTAQYAKTLGKETTTVTIAS